MACSLPIHIGAVGYNDAMLPKDDAHLSREVPLLTNKMGTRRNYNLSITEPDPASKSQLSDNGQARVSRNSE